MGSGGRGSEFEFKSGPMYKESLLGGTAVASGTPFAYRLLPITEVAAVVDIITVDSSGLAGSSFSIPVGRGDKFRSSSTRWVYVSCYSPPQLVTCLQID
ncbi:hypothetical protein L873DRAFT_1837927 [Choiromyces venosus 120613-1]|uniref:Uncharacterized protein n=1 Tax=Choiromyces venosus 120613-1 TaxID=1336337 RepID=A0A3N4JAL4_9PEZI|nr:hypothetical protein L873DRAFT_1837927 [Choiromyces venosus 120613-1]